MAQRYKTIDLATGQEQLKEALVISTGAGDAGKIVALNSDGDIDPSMLPPGVGAETVVAPSSENLGAGEFVNLWNDSGTLKARLADADNGRPANGFVLAAVVSPANATVYPLGDQNTQLSGLTVDSVYFLSKTAGGVTTDISSYGDTDIVQRLGIAISTTAIQTEQNTPAILTDA